MLGGLPLVLVVEDQLILAIGMQAILQEVGLRVAITASVEEARARIKREMPAVAVVDLNLRGELDGLGLVDELGAHGVKVVIASAYSRDNIRRPLPEVVAYLDKPLVPAQLLATVRAALADAAA